MIKLTSLPSDRLRRFRRAAAVALVPALLLTGPATATAQRAPEREKEPPSKEGRPSPRSPFDPGAPSSKSGRGKDAAAKKPVEPKPIPSRIARPGSGGVPDSGADREALLAELYANLASAIDEQTATRVASAIEHVWRMSTTETISLLLDKSVRASKEKRHELAARLLDRAVQLAPDNAEVFKTRAAVNYARDDVRGAIGDLRRAIALEPNDFKALEMLGGIFKELNRKRAAYEVYKKLYDVHPQMQGLKMQLDELEREAIGQPG